MDYNNYEKELDYLINLVESDDKKDWEQALIDLDINMHPDSLRKSFNVGRYCGYNVAKYYQNKIESDILSDEEVLKLEGLKFQLLKERKKLQAFNNEYHKNAREEGRFELFLEKIEDAVNNLEPIKIKSFKESRKKLNRTGVLFISDAHYGREVEMKGLDGEILNKYNPKEFENRMWHLLNQLENDLKVIHIDNLDIIDTGDNIEGILRVGESLKNLKSGVVDSTIQYAEFMANWIIECYNRLGIKIRYSLTGGNHDVLRILESKANFEEETVGKFVYNHINLRVENAKLQYKLDNNLKEAEIEIEPYNDVIFHSYYGQNLLAYHGDTKNMKNDIDFFENFYNVSIDILVGGHLHRSEQETVGVGYFGDREIIRVPSICGIDTYSKKIRGNARAGAKYMVFTENGKDWEKTYFLN